MWFQAHTFHIQHPGVYGFERPFRNRFYMVAGPWMQEEVGHLWRGIALVKHTQGLNKGPSRQGRTDIVSPECRVGIHLYHARCQGGPIQSVFTRCVVMVAVSLSLEMVVIALMLIPSLTCVPIRPAHISLHRNGVSTDCCVLNQSQASALISLRLGMHCIRAKR